MIVNRSAPPGTVVPWLPYPDVAAAIAWLSDAFGFRERLRTPAGPDGSIHHAQVAVGNGSVVCTAGPPASGISLFVAIDDVDSHCERARRSGARIVTAPHTCAFGERQYTAEDPAGYQWTFSQSVADVDPESWGAIVNRR